MGSKSDGQIVGFRYYFGVHMGISRGPLDELVEVKVGDRQAWAGSVTENETVAINAPDLFGGDDMEGGIVGDLTVLMGAPDQPVHSALASMLSGLVPAFRGVATLFYDGQISALNPYPKPWKVRVRRALQGWDGGAAWYPEKAVIELADGAIKAMNGAHIVYQCLTDRSWGRGLATGRIGADSFVAAANTLHDEGLGLCLRWSRQDSIEGFVQAVLNHMGAVLRTDRATGLVDLKLIRDDYDPENLPVFGFGSGLIGIDEDDSGAQGADTNEVIVVYRSPLDGLDRRVRVNNVAALQAQGVKLTTTAEYPGLPTAELALRIAQRDLLASSAFVKRFKLRFDRRGNGIQIGDVFRISVPSRGINNIVLRAGRVDDTPPSDGTITVAAVQDVFALPATSFITPQESEWTPPVTTPEPVTIAALIEAPYSMLAARLPQPTSTPATAGYVGVLARRPTPLSQRYTIASRVGADPFEERDRGSFSPTALLADAMDEAYEDVVVGFTSPFELGGVVVGDAAIIGDEVLRVVSIDLDESEVELARGCADTQPEPHSAGARIWFARPSGMDSTQYDLGETVDVKLLTTTLRGQLEESEASTLSITMAQRQARPYPPANVKINGQAFPDATPGSLAVTWSGRNRITQADQLLGFDEGHVAPEPGVMYRVQIRRDDTDAIVLGPANVPAGAAGGVYNAIGYVVPGVRDYTLELWATRGALTSREAISRSFEVVGYGLDYGEHYGGVLSAGVVLSQGAPPFVPDPIPGVGEDRRWSITVTGTFSANDRFRLFFDWFDGLALQGGTAGFYLRGDTQTSLEGYAQEIESQLVAALGSRPFTIARASTTVHISTRFGSVLFRGFFESSGGPGYWFHPAYSIEQAAAAATTPVRQIVYLDWWQKQTINGQPVEVLAPTSDPAYGTSSGGGVGHTRVTITPLTYDARVAMGAPERSSGFFGGNTISTLYHSSFDNAYAQILASPLSRFFTLSGPLALVSDVPEPQLRHAIVMTVNENYRVETQLYDSAPVTPIGAGYKLLWKQGRSPVGGSAAGLEQVVSFAIQSAAPQPPGGTSFRVTLDGTTFAATLGTGSGGTNDVVASQINSALTTLVAAIDADANYTARVEREATETTPATFVVRRAAPNVPFEVFTNVSYGARFEFRALQ